MSIQMMLLGVGAKKSSVLVDHVFSTFLYEGNSGTQTFNTGIDLAGHGGLVWSKRRNQANGYHFLSDTENGTGKFLQSQESDAIITASNTLTAFNNNGHSIGNYTELNNADGTFVSWTFRKALGFFTCLTFSGSGSTQNISHDLGSVPGMVIVKCVNASENWAVYHRELGNQKVLHLNENSSPTSGNGMISSDYWNNTTPTSSVFTVGSSDLTNASGQNYVAYLFGHNNNDGTFGESGDKDIIKCGSYSGSGSAGLEVNVGFVPQWILFKNATNTGGQHWRMYDTERGIVTNGNDPRLMPNLSDAESSNDKLELTSTGFKLTSTGSDMNGNGDTILYIAIREAE